MKKLRKKIVMIVEKTDTGFSAFAEDSPIYTTGKSIGELMDNALEATSLHFEEEEISVAKDNIKFEIDFKQFFQYYKILNAKLIAAKIGMNPTLLSQYVKGIKNPQKLRKTKL